MCNLKKANNRSHTLTYMYIIKNYYTKQYKNKFDRGLNRLDNPART
jgi:hypothetical protein